MVFKIIKERMYHMPHNTALLGEFKFLLKILEPKQTQYTFKEISKIFQLEQIKQDKFKEFHGNMPYRIFTEEVPPDKDELNNKFKEVNLSKTKPAGMPDWLFKLILKEGY